MKIKLFLGHFPSDIFWARGNLGAGHSYIQLPFQQSIIFMHPTSISAKHFFIKSNSISTKHCFHQCNTY